MTLVIPISVRWLSHINCYPRVLEMLPALLPALNSIYTDKDDFKALGFLLSLLKPEFLLSTLALIDIFQALSLLIHWLQTSPEKADVTQVPVLVDLTTRKLKYLGGMEDQENSMSESELNDRKFTKEKFREHYAVIR